MCRLYRNTTPAPAREGRTEGAPLREGGAAAGRLALLMCGKARRREVAPEAPRDCPAHTSDSFSAFSLYTGRFPREQDGVRTLMTCYRYCCDVTSAHCRGTPYSGGEHLHPGVSYSGMCEAPAWRRGSCRWHEPPPEWRVQSLGPHNRRCKPHGRTNATRAEEKVLFSEPQLLAKMAYIRER